MKCKLSSLAVGQVFRWRGSFYDMVVQSIRNGKYFIRRVSMPDSSAYECPSYFTVEVEGFDGLQSELF